MPDPDPYACWSLSDRLQMLAFEAELAHFPRSLIAAIWQAEGWIRSKGPQVGTAKSKVESGSGTVSIFLSTNAGVGGNDDRALGGDCHCREYPYSSHACCTSQIPYRPTQANASPEPASQPEPKNRRLVQPISAVGARLVHCAQSSGPRLCVSYYRALNEEGRGWIVLLVAGILINLGALAYLSILKLFRRLLDVMTH